MFFTRKQRNPQNEATRVQRGLRTRVLVVKVALLIFFVLIGWRLTQIQIVEAAKYQKIAQRQYETRVDLPAAKGNIYDRNGNVLVSNSMFTSYAADPKIVDEGARRVAEEFSRVFGKPKRYYLDRLRSEKRFVWLERLVPPEIAKRLRSENLEGVVELQEPKRLYHYDEVAGQLLGFTDIDNKGLIGLELQFDKQLCGKDGYVVLQKDGLGKRKPCVDYPREEPTSGANLHLTIDLMDQSVAEEELERGVKSSNADGGLVAVMNPKTGEILALGQYPRMNPNEVSRCNVKDQKLRVVTDLFEPGSVFKIVTASAALEAGLVKPDQMFFGENGKYRVPLRNGRVRVINDTHEYGWITFQQAMELSSNIVMAKVSDIVGGERLYRKAKDFGFGSPTGIEVPGEIRGELKKPSTWSATTLNTMAYGYEVGVTPIQILAAYGAVANGGLLLKPHIVKKIVTAADETVQETKPQSVRKVLSDQVARTLTQFFEGVVERGTATPARIEGVRIAGKTGTSKKHLEGRYQAGSYTASFIGFFPAEDPQVVCLVMVDNPRRGSYFGGQVSAPIFRAIAERMMSTGLQVPRSNRGSVIARMDTSTSRALPDVRTLKLDAARHLLAERSFRTETVGGGDIVLRQSPEAGSEIGSGDTVTLFLTARDKQTTDGYVETPDLRGLTIRRAVNRLTIERMVPTVNGSGLVVSQIPSPGEKVKVGTRVYLNCEPRKLASTSTN
ncbi:MAG: penicillin-binding transpeptidase domain-containing protein [Bacteroidota bacterium]